MKIKHIVLLCVAVFLAFTIIGSIMITLGGAWHRNGFHWGFNWGDFGNIGIGELQDVDDVKEAAIDGVDKISISTVSDDVLLQSGGSQVVTQLKGQCRSVSGTTYLETHQQGSTLYIEVKYPHNLTNNNTDLTVTIPAEYSGSLAVQTVSGRLQAEELPFALDKATATTVSGDINISTASFSSLRADSTSGDITVSGISADVTANTISGSVHLDYNTFATTIVGTVSGSVEAVIPQGSLLNVDFNSVSGDFTSTLTGLGVTSAERGFHSTADNSADGIRVNTTSGDFRITGK